MLTPHGKVTEQGLQCSHAQQVWWVGLANKVISQMGWAYCAVNGQVLQFSADSKAFIARS